MKLVICDQHGGFSLSEKAYLRLLSVGHPEAEKEAKWRKEAEEKNDDSFRLMKDAKARGSKMFDSYCRDIKRDDLALVKLVEELGNEAAGSCASLKIVDIPDDVKWEIEEYDGAEWVSEQHRRWS
jgi:hypothetical protein